jgi:DNA polymerase elongation subunit (family B)
MMEIFQRNNSVLLFDVETSGLDPFEAHLRVFGYLDLNTGDVQVYTANSKSRERDLLGNILIMLLGRPSIGGWNITEFDLSFLSVRAHLHDLHLPIHPVTSEPYTGKYGKARVTIPNRDVLDLAYQGGKELASEQDVKWSLQPVAESYGFKPSVQVGDDRSASASLVQAAQHCLDDLEALRVVYRQTHQ